MRKIRWSKLSAVVASSVLAVGLLAGCGGGGSSTSAPSNDGGSTDGAATGSSVVKIGGIFDETGATGDVGAPYADGARAYFEYLNANGGVNGTQIQLIGEDYAYDISRAQQIYQGLRDRHEVAAIIGWGTGDTEALRSQIIADQLPYFSGSLSENLKSTTDSAFNYLTGASYSDQGRAILHWISENHEGDFPVDLTLVYHKGHPFSESPMQDIKDYAAENFDGKINVVSDLEIEFGDTDPQTTIQSWLRGNSEPDYAIINYTWGQTRNVVRDAKNLGWNTQFIGLNWTAGEGLVPDGDAAQWVESLDGFIAVATHAFPFEDLPGMAAIKEHLESKGSSIDAINQKFVQGWATAAIYAEAVRIAIEQNDDDVISGAEIKAAIESIDNFDLGGLAANVSFSPDRHWGTKEIRLAQLNNGEWSTITDYFGVE